MRDILIAIVLGMILGWLDVFAYRARQWFSRISTGCLLLMLACLGAKIGCDRELLHNLALMGGQSLVLALAVMGGSGGDSIALAAAQAADVLLTGEVKHSSAIDAMTLGISLIVAGHYETEMVVLEPLIKRLQNDCFDVQYNLSRADESPFVRL